jgi:hypothetical protein
MSALLTVEYLEERAQRGNRAKFEQALTKVSRTREPEPGDGL